MAAFPFENCLCHKLNSFMCREIMFDFDDFFGGSLIVTSVFAFAVFAPKFWEFLFVSEITLAFTVFSLNDGQKKSGDHRETFTTFNFKKLNLSNIHFQFFTYSL